MFAYRPSDGETDLDRIRGLTARALLLLAKFILSAVSHDLQIGYTDVREAGRFPICAYSMANRSRER